jgi:hypothetical protein
VGTQVLRAADVGEEEEAWRSHVLALEDLPAAGKEESKEREVHGTEEYRVGVTAIRRSLILLSMYHLFSSFNQVS